jgi:integrase
LCPDCYDYQGAVVWNVHAPELWRRATIAIRRQLAKTARAHGIGKVQLSYAKVAEFQARGLVHFHAIFRLDAVSKDGQLVPPALTADALAAAIRAAARLAWFATVAHPARPHGWDMSGSFSSLHWAHRPSRACRPPASRLSSTASSRPDGLEIRVTAQAADRLELGRAWQDNGLIFTTRTGRPIEPRNLVRSFRRICDANGLRVIKLHHLRHTTATLLKMSGVASDASFPGKRDDGAIGDAEGARQEPEPALGAKGQVRMVVRLRVASGNTMWHQVLLHRSTG